jgi:hypothetical protein
MSSSFLNWDAQLYHFQMGTQNVGCVLDLEEASSDVTRTVPAGGTQLQGVPLAIFLLCLVWVGKRTLFINKALKQDRPRTPRAD